MSNTRKAVLGLCVAATILFLAAAFVTANGALYLLAALAAVATILAWRKRA